MRSGFESPSSELVLNRKTDPLDLVCVVRVLVSDKCRSILPRQLPNPLTPEPPLESPSFLGWRDPFFPFLFPLHLTFLLPEWTQWLLLPWWWSLSSQQEEEFSRSWLFFPHWQPHTREHLQINVKITRSTITTKITATVLSTIMNRLGYVAMRKGIPPESSNKSESEDAKTRKVKLAVASPAGFRATHEKVPFSSVVAFKMSSSLFLSTGNRVESRVLCELIGLKWDCWSVGFVKWPYESRVSITMLSDEFDTGWPLNHHSRVDSGRELTLHRRDTFLPSSGKNTKKLTLVVLTDIFTYKFP